jgi:lipopolysaccharide export system permease protein
MRAARTLSLYVTREVIQYTLLGLAAITMILVTRNLVRVLDKLIGAGFLFSDLLTLLRLFGAELLAYTLPISFLFGVLLAVGRMAADVEVTAMRACGVGVATVTLPPFALGVLLSVFSGYLTLEATPAAQREMRVAVSRMLLRGAAIEPGRFSSVGERLLYVEERQDDNRMLGIVISDRTDIERHLMIFAKSGEMSLDEESGELKLRLEDGDIHVDPSRNPDELYQRLSFATFEYAIDITGRLMSSDKRRAREMSTAELREVVARIDAGDHSNLREKDPTTYAIRLHRRMSAPLAPALFALVGVPLGMRRTRGARSWGALLCAGVAFTYYATQTLCEFLSAQGWLPIAVASWIPNTIFAGLAAWLLSRARYAGA